MNKKRGQIPSQVFVYILAIIIVAMILLLGYKVVNSIQKRGDQVALIQFETDLKNDVELIKGNQGSVLVEKYKTWSGFDEICFVDLQNVDPSDIIDHPIIKDSVESGVNANAFLYGNNLETIYIEDLELSNYPYFYCFQPKVGAVELRIKGKGNAAVIEIPSEEIKLEGTCDDCRWVNDICGGTPCSPNEMRQTKSCNPAGCDSGERCIASSFCSVSGNFINADSGSSSDIQKAVDQAKPGDTVLIPIGTFDFTGEVFAPDGIHIKGMGKDQTKLMKKNGLAQWKAMITVDCKYGKPFSLSGMTLHGEAKGNALKRGETGNIKDMGLYLKGKCINFRVFDNKFIKFGRAAITTKGNVGNVKGQARGVIYKNDFIENWYDGLGYGVEIIGNGIENWDKYQTFSLQLGNDDAVFIEDNYFDGQRHNVASNNGARYVFRYNNIVNSREDAAAIDAHGLSSWPRGTRSYEIYENTLDNSVRIFAGIGIRGGDGVIFNNKMIDGYSNPIILWNEGGSNCGYPCQDQIRELYIWGNTYQGSNPGVDFWRGSEAIIQKDRDYFLYQRPEYTPYTYPHPLRLGEKIYNIPTEMEILYSNDFNDDQIGTYSVSNLKQDWNNPSWDDGVSEGFAEIVSGSAAKEGNSLRIKYPEGWSNNGRGAQWILDLGNSYDELYTSFWIKFENGFDFVKGGKIPGLVGGEANTGGNKPDGRDGWSARMMWHRDGKVVQYVYNPDQPTIYGQNFNWKLGSQKYFNPGTWHHVQTRIVMNTPGEKNGIIQSWFDGELALDVKNIRFRDVDSFAIDKFYFSTFFGGNNPSWGPKRDEFVYFDNFLIYEKKVPD